jgi:hypothetical protein
MACTGQVALDFFSWLGAVLGKMVPWPLLILIFAFHPSLRGGLTGIVEALVELIGNLRQIKVAGVQISADPASARQIAGTSAAIIENDFKTRADKAAAKNKIWEKFESIIVEIIVPELKGLHSDREMPFRSTIHIPDAVYDETTYQLTEYLFRPPEKRPESRGRRLSLRFGIVGRAWRLGRSDYDPEVSTVPAELVEKWGMTYDEAQKAGRGRKSFAVFLLRTAENYEAGALFIDATDPHLFGSQAQFDEIEQKVSAKAKENGLAKALFDLSEELRKKNPKPIRR